MASLTVLSHHGDNDRNTPLYVCIWLEMEEPLLDIINSYLSIHSPSPRNRYLRNIKLPADDVPSGTLLDIQWLH